MTSRTKKLAKEALSLPSKERATLADTLLVSLDRPDPEIDAVWKVEAENRLKAYKICKIKAVPLSRVLANYRKKKVA